MTEAYAVAAEAVKRNPERFWNRVMPVAESGCHIWTCGTTLNGYGLFSTHGVTVLVHRLSWLVERGEIEDGLQLDHLCRVPSCLNCNHLEPVTAAENMRRALVARGGRNRSTITHCPQGHEYTFENTYIQIKANSRHRLCRTCLAIRAKQYAEAKKATEQCIIRRAA